MEHNNYSSSTSLLNGFIMTKALVRAFVSATMVLGLGLSAVVSSSADSGSQATAMAEYRSAKSEFEAALEVYKKAPNATKAAKAAKAALKEVAVAAQKKAENERLEALQLGFATYTDAIARANTNYVDAMAAAGKSAALKNAAKNAKNAAVAAATSAYNVAKADLKALPKVS